MKLNKKTVQFIGRLALSGAVFLYLISKIDLQTVAATVSTLKWEYLALAFIPSIIELLLKSFKWQMLLKVKKINIPYLEIFKIYYISSFIGTFLPSSLGIDLLRTYSMSKYIKNAHDSVSTVFVDRILGIISLVFVVLMGVLAIKTNFVNSTGTFILTIVICLVVLFSGIILFRYVITFIEWLLARFHFSRAKIDRYMNLLDRIYQSIIDFKNNKFSLFQVFLVSIVFQFNRVAIAWVMSLGFDIHVDIKYWIIIVPLVTLATMLPLAVGGIGIREGAFVFFLNQLGVSISTAFLLSISFFLLGVITALPGFALYMTYGLSYKKAPESSQ